MKRLVCFFLAITMLMTSLNLVACKKRGSDPANTPESGETAIYDMRTDDFVEPFGIDNSTPRFSWKMSSNVIGQKQTAYQVTVSDEEGKTVWDSGKTESGDSVDIPYAGETLTSSTVYTWQVTVWDKNGNVVKSPTATFETALLEDKPFADASFVSYKDTSAINDTTYTIDFDFIFERKFRNLLRRYRRQQFAHVAVQHRDLSRQVLASPAREVSGNLDGSSGY